MFYIFRLNQLIIFIAIYSVYTHIPRPYTYKSSLAVAQVYPLLKIGAPMRRTLIIDMIIILNYPDYSLHENLPFKENFRWQERKQNLGLCDE